MKMDLKFTFENDIIAMGMNVELTPANYLESNESRFQRAKLLNNQLNSEEQNLSIMHDRYNDHDNLALEVYCDQIFIGYIRKNVPNGEQINEFCFKSGAMCKLFVKYYQNNLVIQKHLHYYAYEAYLFNAIETSDIKVIKDLGLEVNISGCGGSVSPLSNAVTMKKDINLVRKLIEAGARVDYLCYTCPDWFYSIGPETIEIGELLVKEGINLDYLYEGGNSYLHEYIEGTRIDISDFGKSAYDSYQIEFLIKAGANVNVLGGGGDTPLHPASKSYHLLDVVRILINAGADVNIKDTNGYTPIFYAVENNNLDTVKLLINAGADLSVSDELGRNPFHFSVIGEHIDILKLFISSGVDINIKMSGKWSALHISVSQNKIEVVKLLINAGIYTDVKNEDGNVPLDLANGIYKDEITKLLNQ